ncbi:transposase, partial [Streptococcus suis]|nr:transposase [Streptococcus suis]NQF85213.1 transposase [Streptococcus suis]NQG14334.1 transposase [Streptococcus suis]NQG35959.1 transposase [Streptococcus suis]NQG82174.1 transposase [Streptococcus suis]
MLDQIKAHLLDSINDIVSTANQFLLHPKKDFSRKSQLTRNLDERAAFIDMLKTSSFKQALVIMDRGYESYNVMVHCQERNWSYIIRIRVGNHSMKSGFNLPDTPCFDEAFDLNICRKQTNEMKQLYRDFPNHYRCLPNHTSFDFLPNSSRKRDPLQFYDLHFRMVRLEIKPGFFETLVTN